MKITSRVGKIIIESKEMQNNFPQLSSAVASKRYILSLLENGPAWSSTPQYDSHEKIFFFLAFVAN